MTALQINNWNESKKFQAKETVYLNGLKADFEQSQVALERVIKKTSLVAKMADTLHTLIKTSADQLTPQEIDSLSDGSVGFTVFMASEGIVNYIIGSVKLDMLENNQLRKK